MPSGTDGSRRTDSSWRPCSPPAPARIPVTNPARTLFDLGAVVSAQQLKHALNEAEIRRLLKPAHARCPDRVASGTQGDHRPETRSRQAAANRCDRHPKRLRDGVPRLRGEIWGATPENERPAHHL